MLGYLSDIPDFYQVSSNPILDLQRNSSNLIGHNWLSLHEGFCDLDFETLLERKLKDDFTFSQKSIQHLVPVRQSHDFDIVNEISIWFCLQYPLDQIVYRNAIWIIDRAVACND